MSDDTLQRMARSVLDGSATLFIGAGLSFLSKNAAGEILPNGEQLIISLHAGSGATKSYALDKIANFYIKKHGPLKLYDCLTQALTVSSGDRRLSNLYKYPWRRIYTTN